MAQRHGGGGFGGGMRGGSGGGVFRGGGGFGGGGFGGNFLHPTTRQSFGFRFNGGRGFGRSAFFGSSLFSPFFGFGLGYGYWPDYYGGYPYSYDPYAYNPYGYGGGYASYQTSPNVTVIYPSQAAEQAPAAPPERARPVTREYDQYGQEVRPGVAPGGGSPVYLIAFNDRVIRAAAAYWVDGKTLHYVTLQHEERQAPLDTVDRALSLQLNRERQVPFQMPAQ